jgi:signal transduction histidine kinase
METEFLHNAMERLVAVIQELSLARDVATAMALVRHAARALTGADGASFVLREGDWCYYADEEAIGPLWKGQRFPMTACISGWVMVHRLPAVIGDIYADARIPVAAYAPTFVKSLVMVPIRTAAPLGALGVYWAQRHRATPGEVKVLQALADSTSIAFDNIQLYAELAQRVEERTAALAKEMAERQRLEQESQRAAHFALLGRLMACVSHDIRSPLAALFLHVDLLEEEWRAPSPDSQRVSAQALAEIKTNLVQLNDLVQDYLSLVRVSTIERTPQDLGAAVRAWATEWQAWLTTRGVTLRLDGIDDLGQVAFHPSRLRRVLRNLVQNALDAMPQGGTVTLTGQRTATQIQLQVCDTGDGIPAERLSHIFEPLYTTKPGGTGLGLYIVQEIVAAHGGQVTVQSTVGHGTTFTLTLPQAAGEAGTAR